jgi:hypothetical protein
VPSAAKAAAAAERDNSHFQPRNWIVIEVPARVRTLLLSRDAAQRNYLSTTHTCRGVVMKTFRGSILLFMALVSPTVRASNCSTTAGGVSVTIPAPVGGFVEVSSEKRDFFQYMVPARNHLLCAFVPADRLPLLKNPARGMTRYMVVEGSRKMDEGNLEVTEAIFQEIVSGIKQQLGDTNALNQILQTTAEELSRKLKAVDASKDVAIGQVTPLGTLFQRQDVYAFAMVAPVSSAGATSRMINASVVLRVRERLLFAYVYAGASDETSLKWVEQTAQQWAQQIVTANADDQRK